MAGPKRVAFVPVFRSVAAQPDQIPPNWEQAILARVLFNPRPEANGADRSLRAWLRAASSGRADIDPVAAASSLSGRLLSAVGDEFAILRSSKPPIDRRTACATQRSKLSTCWSATGT